MTPTEQTAAIIDRFHKLADDEGERSTAATNPGANGTIIAAFLAFLESSAGQAILAALLALLTKEATN